MQSNTSKERAPVNPDGSDPCCPYNHKARSEVALSVFNAVHNSGAAMSIQMISGDLAYCGKNLREIEFVLANAGATPEQCTVAVKAVVAATDAYVAGFKLPVEKIKPFEVIPVAKWAWWPYFGYMGLDDFVLIRDHNAALEQNKQLQAGQ
ncbi:MAG: hypothetical protein ACYC4S_18950 [Rhodoferax sp.]